VFLFQITLTLKMMAFSGLSKNREVKGPNQRLSLPFAAKAEEVL
jgi:hypothetical protein